MKIAVGFFGIPRCSAITLPSIQRQVLDAMKSQGEVDVYYHFFMQNRITNPRSGEDSELASENYAAFKGFKGVMETPDECLERWEFEKVKEYGDPYGDDFRSLRNLYHQLHSLYMLTELIEKSNPDVVIFLRPDLRYLDPLPADLVIEAARTPRTCFVPQWQWYGGFNDRFAICGRSAYRAYGQRIRMVLDFCLKTGAPLHPESLLRYALLREQVIVRTTPMRANRIRVEGNEVNECFSIWKTIGPAKYLIYSIQIRILTWFERNLRKFGFRNG
jgi:hypothetical protein